MPVDFEIVLADGSSKIISIDVSSDARAKSTRSFDSDVLDVVIDPLTQLLAKWTINQIVYPSNRNRRCPKKPAHSPPIKCEPIATLTRLRSPMPSIIPTWVLRNPALQMPIAV